MINIEIEDVMCYKWADLQILFAFSYARLRGLCEKGRTEGEKSKEDCSTFNF